MVKQKETRIYDKFSSYPDYQKLKKKKKLKLDSLPGNKANDVSGKTFASAL